MRNPFMSSAHEYQRPVDPGGEPPNHDQSLQIRLGAEVICQGMKALRYAPIEDIFSGKIWDIRL